MRVALEEQEDPISRNVRIANERYEKMPKTLVNDVLHKIMLGQISAGNIAPISDEEYAKQCRE
jgi:hypothetical protein